MEKEKPINTYTIELTDAYFKTRDGQIQGKYNRGMTKATWEQIKENAKKQYEYQFKTQRGTTNNQRRQIENKEEKQ